MVRTVHTYSKTVSPLRTLKNATFAKVPSLMYDTCLADVISTLADGCPALPRGGRRHLKIGAVLIARRATTNRN